MAPTSSDSSERTGLPTGAKVTLLLAPLLLLPAIYFYFLPVYLTDSKGGLFICGSAASPNTESAKVCDLPETINQYRTLLFLGLAAVTGLLGWLLWGAGSRRRDDRWEDEDEDYGDRRGRSRHERDHRRDRDDRRARRWDDDDDIDLTRDAPAERRARSDDREVERERTGSSRRDDERGADRGMRRTRREDPIDDDEDDWTVGSTRA